MPLSFVSSKLLVCPKQYVKNQPSLPLPLDWLKNNLSGEYKIVDFDGYTIDFSQKKITAFFMKKEFEYNALEDVSKENILNLFYSNEFQNEWLERLKISEILNVPLFFFCWPKDYPNSEYSDLSNPVYIFHVSLKDGKPLLEKIKQGTKQDVQEFIFSYRKKKFSNVKPLRISKTHMECYLSTTSSPWPGDLDGVIFDIKNQNVVGILEFKTHNLDSAIENEEISKYAAQDLRRFSVLAYLQKNLSDKQSVLPSLLFIVWGTKQIHKKIKIQKIGDGKVISQEYVDSPLFTENYAQFVGKVLEMC